MCAEVILLVAYMGHAAGERLTLALNMAIEMVDAGKARWA